MRFSYVVIGLCCLLGLSGCMHHTPVQSPDDQAYQSAKIDKTPPKVKEEHWIEPTSKEEIEANEKKEAMISDFEKRERYHR